MCERLFTGVMCQEALGSICELRMISNQQQTSTMEPLSYNCLGLNSVTSLKELCENIELQMRSEPR